jgi:5'-nucleotidase
LSRSRTLSIIACAALSLAAPLGAQGAHRILVVNDDGIASPGIEALARALSDLGEVTVVAPEHNQSGISMAVTFDAEVPLLQPDKGGGIRWFAADLKPADCVTLGLDHLMPERPDLVVSGINKGSNLGNVTTSLSGTIGAARMAALHGLPAIAVSMGSYRDENLEWQTAAELARRLARQVLTRGLPAGVLLNLNVPNRPLGELRGVRVTRLGRQEFGWHYDEVASEGGAVRLQQGTHELPNAGTLDDDLTAFAAGYATITPLTSDTTALELLREVGTWDLEP